MEQTERARRLRRRRLLSWVPTVLVVLACTAFFVGAYAMRTSWWVETDPVPSDDQQASDGSSMFGRGGVDYLTRRGVMRITVGPGSLPASELDLAPNGEATFATVAPVRVIVTAPEGEFVVGLVSTFSVETADDEVRAVRIVSGRNGSWVRANAGVEHAAPAWGWTQGDIDRLRDDAVAASNRSEGGESIASIPAAEHLGALVSAEMRVDVAEDVSVTYIVRER